MGKPSNARPLPATRCLLDACSTSTSSIIFVRAEIFVLRLGTRMLHSHFIESYLYRICLALQHSTQLHAHLLPAEGSHLCRLLQFKRSCTKSSRNCEHPMSTQLVSLPQDSGRLPDLTIQISSHRTPQPSPTLSSNIDQILQVVARSQPQAANKVFGNSLDVAVAVGALQPGHIVLRAAKVSIRRD